MIKDLKKGFTRTLTLPLYLQSKYGQSRRQSRCRGFTLLETVVVIAIFSIILVALVSSFIFFYRSNTFSLNQAFAVTSGRRGVENVVKDIREATYSDEGSYPVISMGTSTLSFFSDIDRDNKIEKVRYFLEGELLKKGVTEAVGDPPLYSGGTEQISVVSEYVRNLQQSMDIFTFFDESGVEITDYNNVSDLTFVRVNLVINVNPIRAPNEFTLRSSATLRNIISNL